MTKLIKVIHNGEIKPGTIEIIEPIDAEIIQTGIGRNTSDASAVTTEQQPRQLTDSNPVSV